MPLVACHLLQPLNHAEHDAHRYKANAEEYSPAILNWPQVIHHRTNPNHQVAQSSCAQPKTLAETYKMTRCHFRYKRQSKRADKQFSHRQEEVGYYQYPRPCFFQTRAIIMPTRMANTGPPTMGNKVPKYQQGRASRAQRATPATRFLTSSIRFLRDGFF